MALDFSLLNENGFPQKIISIDAISHQLMLEVILEGHFPLLQKAHDYYEDADFEKNEISLLVLELNLLKDSPFSSQRPTLVDDMINLAMEAEFSAYTISFIAD